jgi:hypothetical protein
MIVGRDPDRLDEAGVSRAAIESLAENFSDGVTAPASGSAVLGLPGIVLYKAINTADSMIGHRNPRHEAFGWAAARLDDLVNLPASRLTAALIVAAAAFDGPEPARRAALRTARRAAPPLAQCRLAGGGHGGGARPQRSPGLGSTARCWSPDAFMGEGRTEAHAGDIRAALRLYRGRSPLAGDGRGAGAAGRSAFDAAGNLPQAVDVEVRSRWAASAVEHALDHGLVGEVEVAPPSPCDEGAAHPVRREQAVDIGTGDAAVAGETAPSARPSRSGKGTLRAGPVVTPDMHLVAGE